MNKAGLDFLRRHQRLLAVLVLVLILVLVARSSGMRDSFTLTHLRELLMQHQLDGLLIFIALFVLGNLMHVPGVVFMTAAVLVFGRLSGGFATYLAALTSCLVTFLVVRAVGGDALQRMTQPWAARLLRQLHRRPVRNIVLLRTVFQTLPALNYSLALSGVGLRRYFVGTALGLPLPIAVYCSLVDLVAGLVSA